MVIIVIMTMVWQFHLILGILLATGLEIAIRLDYQDLFKDVLKNISVAYACFLSVMILPWKLVLYSTFIKDTRNLS